MSPQFLRQHRARRALELGLVVLIALTAVVTPGLLREDGGKTVAAADSAPTTQTTVVVHDLAAEPTYGLVPVDEQAFHQGHVPSKANKLAVAYANATPEQRAALDAFLTPPPPAPVPVVAPAPQPVVARPVVAAPAVGNGSVWDRLAQCEASGNWATHTSNGYSGGLQFVNSTWIGFGGGQFAPQAWQATREQQIVVAERVLASSGWGAWPACSRKLGLR
jgi:hypothetical protein